MRGRAGGPRVAHKNCGLRYALVRELISGHNIGELSGEHVCGIMPLDKSAVVL